MSIRAFLGMTEGAGGPRMYTVSPSRSEYDKSCRMSSTLIDWLDIFLVYCEYDLTCTRNEVNWLVDLRTWLLTLAACMAFTVSEWHRQEEGLSRISSLSAD